MISERLKNIANLVSFNNTVFDIGTDHAFLPIYLIQNKIAIKVNACDVNEMPLKNAKDNVLRANLENDIILTLSDGLKNIFEIPNDSTLIISGMGGILIKNILDFDLEKTYKFDEIIIEPQSDVESIRNYLFEKDFIIIDEIMIKEKNKFYPIIKFIPKRNIKTINHYKRINNDIEIIQNEDVKEIEKKYGRYLINSKSEIFIEYINKRIDLETSILKNISETNKSFDKKNIVLKELNEIKNIIENEIK